MKKGSKEGEGHRLSPAMFEILLSLAGGMRHGYAIMQEVEERTEGDMRLGPATLYRSIKQLEQMGYIEASEEEGEPSDSERRRYYALQEPGRRAAERRAGSLARSVEVARARNLLVEPETP